MWRSGLISDVWSADCPVVMRKISYLNGDKKMKNNLLQRILSVGCISVLLASYAFAQHHKWAGRTLDDFEWTIHETLATLPSSGVFDTVKFEVQGKTVTLTGQVVSERVKQNAERVLRQLDGVENVVNQIEVLPSSQRDDALRMNVYRVLYEKQPLEKYGTRAAPAIHIIVKNGWVTLEGVVDSDADRSAAHLRALNVTPHVSDNLRVAPVDE
jgi:hyperosmotically inducible protein